MSPASARACTDAPHTYAPTVPARAFRQGVSAPVVRPYPARVLASDIDGRPAIRPGPATGALLASMLYKRHRSEVKLKHPLGLCLRRGSPPELCTPAGSSSAGEVEQDGKQKLAHLAQVYFHPDRNVNHVGNPACDAPERSRASLDDLAFFIVALLRRRANGLAPLARVRSSVSACPNAGCRWLGASTRPH